MNPKVKKNLVKTGSAIVLASALIAAGEISGILKTSTVHATHIDFDRSQKWYANGKPEALIEANGEYVFCIEPGSWLDKDQEYASLKPSNTRLDRQTLKDIEEIAYFAYYSKGQSRKDYIVAQVMIWERVVGGTYDVPEFPDLDSIKAKVKSDIATYHLGASFAKASKEVTLGEAVTLTDTNGWLSLTGATASSLEGWDISIDGDTLKATPNGNAKNGKVTLTPTKVKSYEGTSIVYATTETAVTPDGEKDIQDVALLKMKDLKKDPIELKAIKYMSVHTEKSISSINRLMTDVEAKAAGVDLTQTVFALYKDGKPVKWTDTEHVRPRW